MNSSNKLKEILLNYHDGQIILESYKINNDLNSNLRNKLSHILISHALKDSTERKISTEKLLKLSQDVSVLFPNENKETYYTPYKKESNRVSPARGKLWDKYCNLRREIRKNLIKSKTPIHTEDLNLNNEGTYYMVLFKNFKTSKF